MDSRLLRHYEGELAFLREMGGEFSRAFPKIAARLGMEGLEVVDPYVERLLEGVAFLSARVQLELEMQFPALTSHLLEIVYPHYLAPTPSMMVASFQPDPTKAPMVDGYTLPRGTNLRSKIAEGAQTACLFRTAQDVTLWPIEIVEAEYIDGRGELVAAGVAKDVEAKAGIRLRLRTLGQQPMSSLSLDRLSLFLNSQSGVNWQLHEVLSTEVTGVIGRSTDRRADWTMQLPDGAAVPRGFDRSEALLPTPRRSFDGYRLLQEYFAMPERFHFVDLVGLSPAVRKSANDQLDIYILLREGRASLAPAIAPSAFTLFASPAVNLFTRRCDRIHLKASDVEQHVVADRTAPMDYEIYRIEGVTGISGEGEDDVKFRPFYSSDDFTAAGDVWPAYYTQHRRMRQRSEKERLRGVRTSYLGSELYVTLVDSRQAPYSANLNQLAVTAQCTNRDLPLLLATGSDNIFHLPDGGPVKAIRTPVPPTRPRPTLAQGDTAWRLISHLSLNYLSVADTAQGGGMAALKELIGIYAPQGDRVMEKQLEGILSVSSRPIVRRIQDEVLSTAVRGIEIKIDFDEAFFEGTSVYLLGAVLQKFFEKYVSMNSFTETVLTTHQRGEIARWRPAKGLGRIV
ncbi:type VI secretion system baseplate subunit TssF [Albidovulum sp.]|uniref:type VI secretion system baseplate subunit TssF n=1 Tax=Albidovulum sp. TaxID=1872424 RepID=UPI001DDE7200|nr:type VI secretion system baseplate subunit TssF [Paracoccaceae bacterium]MCC0046485.1 type VI secretion system baseplate subunit TssF [Defluviimonas sp.]HPE26184.1 type VI secretion system baseplate subunit TssF [Albidovulum sp.]MCB2119475.1 type VI secretion system baseplate subunit TssF [Paracoccaceae bacterium]MCB2122004.1 type VI secretion system baseplate subunit TssF [Paracoccaceae bacterium]